MSPTQSNALPSTPDADPFFVFNSGALPDRTPTRRAITIATRVGEVDAVDWLRRQITIDHTDQAITNKLAKKLVLAVRKARVGASGVDALMQEFSLSSEEGIALMCLAEALLRIPDHQTADRLIADKMSHGDWRKHLGASPSLFVNAATWGLLITGKLVGTNSEHTLSAALTRLIGKGGEPLIRKSLGLAMRMLGNQFVCGQTIDEAVQNSRANETRGYCYSYDMLGESALTADDAARYFAAYENAIHAIGKASNGRGIKQGPGISVKLSALHPRYVKAQQGRVMRELLPQLKRLLVLAQYYDIGLNIDAEEADRLELSLDLIEALTLDPALSGYAGLGVAVQAYQKRCPWVIDFLLDLAQRSGRKIMVRLVKGAYWDTEIKRAQVDGLPGYPVFTRKVYSDLSYLVCAQKLLRASDYLYPQFATHNAHTLAAIHTAALKLNVSDYEFQCLYGMGEALYDQVVPATALGRRCRIYAPVGSHQTLLAYLVRRLLENGANSSFVNQLVDPHVDIDTLLADPIAQATQYGGSAHPQIVLPAALFGTERVNSAGIDLNDELALAELSRGFAAVDGYRWQAAPLIAGHRLTADDTAQVLCNPADRRDCLGSVIEANGSDVDSALAAAERHAVVWQSVSPSERARMLTKGADLFEQHAAELLAMLVREAGKSLPNALAEVREAVDFLRYYAAQIDHTGASIALGPVVCISPWNFPLAIFVGQISAALAAGNVVLAKPAEQTPVIAWRATQLLHAAGIPREALQLLPGSGALIGARLIADRRVRGVVFTGSTEVALSINRTLAARAIHEHDEVPLIAETGGQNAMIVDASALLEQVVQDVITSAFDSAGQRCSALRILYLQDDIAERTLALLKGAMQQLTLGNPACLSTDIGPVIDNTACDKLHAHINRLSHTARHIFSVPLPSNCMHGTWVAPTLIEIDSLNKLDQEVFGPVLHVLRYRREDLPSVIDQIKAMGYGLTFGIHSRIDATIDFVCQRIQAGNMYVNRNIVGAVVGVQPFGGTGKSGTGPKAGGPFYLRRLQQGAAQFELATPHTSAVTTSAFCDLMAWGAQHGVPSLSALGRSYTESNLIGQLILLAGPTGERNTLTFVPRGMVLCMASTLEVLLNQLAAVLASRNTAVLDEVSFALIPASLPTSIRDQLICIAQIDDAAVDVRLALVDTQLLAAVGASTTAMAEASRGTLAAASIRSLLASREGTIIPLIETDAHRPIAMWRMVTERVVSVNTTAAGGNASLLALPA